MPFFSLDQAVDSEDRLEPVGEPVKSARCRS